MTRHYKRCCNAAQLIYKDGRFEFFVLYKDMKYVLDFLSLFNFGYIFFKFFSSRLFNSSFNKIN